MKKKTDKYFFLGGILICLILLSGCAGSKTYLLNFGYDSSKTPPFLSGASKPLTLAVYTLQDSRPDPLYFGRRVYRDGQVDFYKPDGGTVERVVTQSLIKLFERAGFKVILVNRYLDSEKEDFKDMPGDAAFGGKIEVLWVEAKSGIATTDTEAKMRLRISWAVVKERTWINKTIEGSVAESDRPLYQVKHAEAKINEVFKDGLDKLLKDENLLREKLLKIQ